MEKMNSASAKLFLADMAKFWEDMCKDSDDLADACRKFANQKEDLNKSQIAKVIDIQENFMPFFEEDLFILLDILDDIDFYAEPSL